MYFHGYKGDEIVVYKYDAVIPVQMSYDQGKSWKFVKTSNYKRIS
jgi:hypothetical protein